jgi:NAD(P)-dependent dehydrogenase (short-subunit alcohol dehydrogenase family)
MAYGNATTTDEVLEGLDLTGRRIVITGAATGLGRESARALAAHGASVTILARSDERAAEGVRAVQEAVPGAQVDAGAVDLGDLASIRAFAERFVAERGAIDVLINNAGVMACPFGRTVDGFETQFGTNHLGHFVLTALLWPLLQAGDAPRVVTLSSAAHSRADVDLEDPNFERTPYSAWVAYGQSKTANALFARELAHRAGGGVLSYSVHPGGIMTDLGRHLTMELIEEMGLFQKERAERAAARDGDAETPDAGPDATGIVWKSVEAGAATQVWAATSTDPELLDANGAYLADCGLGVLGANPGANGMLPSLLDDDRAARLWELSEALVGATFRP